jgi:hypothetical protein
MKTIEFVVFGLIAIILMSFGVTVFFGMGDVLFDFSVWAFSNTVEKWGWLVLGQGDWWDFLRVFLVSYISVTFVYSALVFTLSFFVAGD